LNDVSIESFYRGKGRRLKERVEQILLHEKFDVAEEGRPASEQEVVI
jgi:hypothetical protein